MTADLAEECFERYLRNLGYSFEYEQDLGTPKRPDYLVHAAGSEIVCEVESFTTMGIFADGNRVATRTQREAFAPVRDHIKKAAAQLRGVENRPLVVVLANPLGRPIPLEPYAVMAAMYGDVTVEFSLGSGREATWLAGANRRLQVTDPQTGASLGGHHGYISAVAVVRESDLAFEAWTEEWFARHRDDAADVETLGAAYLRAAQGADVPHSNDVYLDVFETVGNEAIQLPRDIFNGPLDRRWVPNDERSALVPYLE